jgi:hypothetical protein
MAGFHFTGHEQYDRAGFPAAYAIEENSFRGKLWAPNLTNYSESRPGLIGSDKPTSEVARN